MSNESKRQPDESVISFSDEEKFMDASDPSESGEAEPVQLDAWEEDQHQYGNVTFSDNDSNNANDNENDSDVDDEGLIMPNIYDNPLYNQAMSDEDNNSNDSDVSISNLILRSTMRRRSNRIQHRQRKTSEEIEAEIKEQTDRLKNEMILRVKKITELDNKCLVIETDSFQDKLNRINKSSIRHFEAIIKPFMKLAEDYTIEDRLQSMAKKFEQQLIANYGIFMDNYTKPIRHDYEITVET